MSLKYLQNINSYFQLGSGSRSQKAVKNIVLLLVFNFINFVCTLLLVPLTLKYLGPVQYGIWLTISSILTWFSFLDFGIGNGLRNKLSEAFANKNMEKAKIFVSTAYVIFGGGITILIILFLLLHNYINWPGIFNAPTALKDQLNLLLVIVFFLFSLQLFLKLIYSINQAIQRPALNGLISSLSNVFSVLFLLILYKYSTGDLVALGTGLSLIPVIVLILISAALFAKFYKNILPRFKYVKMNQSEELFGLGLRFFVIQIAGLIVFATDNLIITQLFGPADVTVYNIAYKLFYFVPIIFNVIITPFWSAYTEAYVKGEFEWIKNSVNKIMKLWIVLSLGVIVMVVFSSTIYHIWVGSEIYIPLELSIMMGLFAILSNWNNIFAYFINGIGKIQIQFYNSIFVAIINIPLSIYFARGLNWGITGVMAATCVCVAIGSIWAPIQYIKIINKKAYGIWFK
jgi:O-antigen/teichoic acid export membrane protein